MTELMFRDRCGVSLVQALVSDALVVQAARVSTVGAESMGMEADAGLIRYLLKNNHWSPFEHGSFTFLVEAPIFVAREWMRHKSFSFNEESGRYKKLDPVFYIPNAGRPLVQHGKAGHYTFDAGTEEQYLSVEHNLRTTYTASYGAYERLLEEGVAREVARMVLPVGVFTSFYATCNPRSLIHFLGLRDSDFAQQEIRAAAQDMRAIFQSLMPITAAALLEVQDV